MNSERVLFIGAHTDDIEHGAGASLLYLIEKGYQIVYMTFSLCQDLSRNIGIEDDQAKIRDFLVEKRVRVEMHDLPNRFLFDKASEIREILEGQRDFFSPALVFSHWRNDIHQDHRTISSEVRRVFKKSTILEYECLPSCPGFIPNFFIPISDNLLTKKIRLLELYKTQSKLYYNDPSAISSLARVRGLSCQQELAEGFYSSCITLSHLGK